MFYCTQSNKRARVYFNVQFYTKCAVLNPFVQFLKLKCAVTKLTKIPLWMLQKIPELLSLIEHKKYKRFLRGEDSRPPIFLTNHLRAGVMEKKVKLGRAKLPKRD